MNDIQEIMLTKLQTFDIIDAAMVADVDIFC